MANGGVHDGHRQRMRDRIAKQGIESLQPHEALEYLLYSFVPRRDTNALAHSLIDKFGSLAGVFGADAALLEEVPGMTANAAQFLNVLPGVFRMYLDQRTVQKTSLKGRAAARMFMGNKLFGIKEEQIYIAALNVHEDLICCDRLATGAGDAVSVTVRSIVDYAIRNKANGILLAHNHPSGNVNPSHADVELTYTILDTLSNVEVKLLDHFIFCGTEYYSFEEDGRLGRMLKTKTTFKDGIDFYD